MKTTHPHPSMGSREARMKFRDALDHVIRGEQVEITRHGRAEAWMVSPEWYERAARALFNAEINGDTE